MAKSRGSRRKQRARPFPAVESTAKMRPGGESAAAPADRAPLFKKLDSMDDDEREHGCLAIAAIATEGPEQLQELLQQTSLQQSRSAAALRALRRSLLQRRHGAPL